jgi:hypothetical protein
MHSADPSKKECTLLETISSMYDRRFRTVKLLTQTDPVCTQQLDWPFIGGKMQDGSVSLPRYYHSGQPQQQQQQRQEQVPTESETNTCNVLDRLPVFQYRYQPVGSITKPPNSKTSLSAGGACHMGRAARLPSSNSNVTITSMLLCRKIYTNHTHIVARCFKSTGSIHYRDVEMEREMSAAPDWMVQHMRRQRQRCSPQQCDAIPSASAWKTESSQTTPLPHGPEVSYCIPFRWSASRLLAADMRSILCSSNRSTSHHNSFAASSSSLSSSSSSFRRKYHNDTPECDALLNLPAWTVDQFIWSYTDDTFHTLLASAGMADSSSVPPSLLQVHEQMMTTTTITAAAGTAAGEEKATTAAAAFLLRPDEDDLLWDGPNAPAWVACNQNNKTCYGKISKQQFYAANHHRARAKKCVNVFSEQVRNGLVNSTAVGLDICNLNSRTNHMCQILKAVQVSSFVLSSVFFAHSKKATVCM